jgi:RNA 2',3'-cyclic 3'-phosphodiesterase
MRVFIAIDTPLDIKIRMVHIQSEFKKTDANVKWESTDKFHVTIKFLGEVKETMLNEISDTIQKVCTQFSPFRLRYESIGCFPNLKNPSVIWIGCSDISQNLSKFKLFLDAELQKFGFETEKRGFHPHITLGRVKSSRGIKNLIPIIENLTFKSEEIESLEILLMKSVLKPSGSEYSILKSFFLKQNKYEIK